jgi:sRNA-binding protein
VPLLHAALKRYTADHRYSAGHVVGASRIDLDGQPAGTVTEDQVKWVSRDGPG